MFEEFNKKVELNSDITLIKNIIEIKEEDPKKIKCKENNI